MGVWLGVGGGRGGLAAPLMTVVWGGSEVQKPEFKYQSLAG